jgi:Cys-tRNA synthase (O-phospho-L-seryl-tRNA:Cys-tRNA synthase)
VELFRLCADIDFKNKTINVNKNCLDYTDFDAEAGMNIKVVSKLLGHSKIQLTLDIYSQVLEQFQDEKISKVTNYFKDKELF